MYSKRQNRIKFNKRKRLFKTALSVVDKEGQKTFRIWLEEHREAKRSQQFDLPSSQLPNIMNILNPNIPQLFVVIDTCSIVANRNDFIDYVTTLRKMFHHNTCPVKITICLAVLEELDKCNRPRKKRSSELEQQQQEAQRATATIDERFAAENGDIVELVNSPAKFQDPPRYFMRFIEEEIRMSEILISELDPFKRTPYLNKRDESFEIINSDDRILDCCIRTKAYLHHNNVHSGTKVILVTEDNILKTKATTYGVVSYRWKEFKLKYKNFGLKHYTSTPGVNVSATTKPIPSSASTRSSSDDDLPPDFYEVDRRYWNRYDVRSENYRSKKLNVPNRIPESLRKIVIKKFDGNDDPDVQIIKVVVKDVKVVD